MPALRELQEGFAKALLKQDQQDLEIPVRAIGLPGVRRFSIYRNNVLHSLSNVLRACYPVVKKLVGQPFFDFAARHYIRDYPSVSGNLQNYGARFASFLRDFAPAGELVYLPDVARLEWAMQEVYHAAGARPLDLEALTQVPPEHQSQLRFHLHPASRLLESRFLILQIWQANQAEFTDDLTVNLNADACRLLVIRRDYAIEMEPLTESEFVLLSAFREGSSLKPAFVKANAVQPDFDLGASLQDFVSRQVLVGFSLNLLQD